MRVAVCPTRGSTRPYRLDARAKKSFEVAKKEPVAEASVLGVLCVVVAVPFESVYFLESMGIRRQQSQASRRRLEKPRRKGWS